MLINSRKECPHILTNNLISFEDFKKIFIDVLKCEKCEEKTELLICLHCGLPFCSLNIKAHIIEHYNENKEHILYLDIKYLNIYCLECPNINNEESIYSKGCYIDLNKTNEYIKFYKEIKQKTIENQKKEDIEVSENIIQEEFLEEKKELCSHLLNEEIEDQKNFDYLKFLYLKGYILESNKIYNYVCLCLNCFEVIYSKEKTYEHYNNQKHKLFLNYKKWKLLCLDCSFQCDIILAENILKYKIICTLMNEVEIFPLSNNLILTENEIKEIKYDNFKNNIMNKKYSKIVFMVGAGISTSAGIPDFRSDTGLFKQLQIKYNLSKPEEFFWKKTFLEKPQYFYEFTKLFDLSKIKSTITHKFINFFVQKNIVKYIYTQNIDGLELKAKIPNEKLIFCHGNFFTGNCAKCNKEIDIQKINEGIEKGEVYYCPTCGGPCKPNVVFYGESLPFRFFEKLQECRDADLFIIMGTSLSVNPFASIPYLANRNADVVLFNKCLVGKYEYNKLYCNALFIEGKTDENVIKILKDCNMIDEFKNFIKNEYKNEFKDIEEIEKMVML